MRWSDYLFGAVASTVLYVGVALIADALCVQREAMIGMGVLFFAITTPLVALLRSIHREIKEFEGGKYDRP